MYMCVSARALPVTLLTLQDELVVCVRPLAQWATAQAVTRSTQAVVTLPIRAQPRGGGATLHAPHTPGEKTHNHARLGISTANGKERERKLNEKRERRSE